jgi:hypothetical protein
MYNIKVFGKYLRIYNRQGQYLFGLSLGNSKLTGKNKFAILNFTPAFLCKSDSNGQCEVCDECYAKGAEWLRQMVLRFRYANFHFFQHYGREEIMSAFAQVCEWLEDHGIELLRLQESGDFLTQWWLDLAYSMAWVANMYGIKTFTYTARSDLTFYPQEWGQLIIRGSGWDGPNGKTIALDKGQELPVGFRECRLDCARCGLCYNRKIINIAFRKHGNYREQPVSHNHWKKYHEQWREVV